MLVLTRHVRETLMIGDEVAVTVLAIQGERIKIGIQAPRNIAVDRKEIYERKKLRKNGFSPLKVSNKD